MVGKRRFFEEREVDRLQIICKECSARLHAANADDDMHNLWELIWVRDNFVHLLATVLSAQMSDSCKHGRTPPSPTSARSQPRGSLIRRLAPSIPRWNEWSVGRCRRSGSGAWVLSRRAIGAMTLGYSARWSKVVSR